MRPNIDLTDVVLVSPHDMATAMQYFIDAGRGLLLLNGATPQDLRAMERAVWDKLDEDPVQKVATLMRFRCLVEVFAAPRLKALLLNKGFNLLAPALHVAASQRLNAERGFNPVKFERALVDLVVKLQAARDPSFTRAAA